MRLIPPALLVVAFVAWTSRAHAYPQFQLAQGADRCSACHFSPAGGGLLNDFGRDEASSISDGGDGRFLHGAWEPPSWIRLGADVRLATAVKAYEGDSEVLAFPMQGDLYVRAGGDHFSANITLGVRGGARDPQPRFVERLASREHYVMYERAGHYMRLGRFFPVFGLRSQDHTVATRRYLGFHTLEEPYGLGAGTGGDTWELHASAFLPRPVEVLGAGVRSRGATVYAERRFLDDTSALGAQARIATSDADARATVGVIGKRYFADAKVMLLGEVDLQRQSFDVGPTRYQLAAYAGASRFVADRWMVGGAVHRWQADLRYRTARDAVEINVQYFPRAHFELHLLVRVNGSGDFDHPALLSLLQLHYYL